MPRRVLTRAELAAAFACHMQTVTKWERAGMPIARRGSRGRPSQYSLPDVVAWFIERELAARGAPGSAISPLQEKALLDKARREEIALRLQIRRGELVSPTGLRERAFAAARVTRDLVLGIPDRVSAEIAAESDAMQVHDRLTQELRQALESAANWVAGLPTGGADHAEDQDGKQARAAGENQEPTPGRRDRAPGAAPDAAGGS